MDGPDKRRSGGTEGGRAPTTPNTGRCTAGVDPRQGLRTRTHCHLGRWRHGKLRSRGAQVDRVQLVCPPQHDFDRTPSSGKTTSHQRTWSLKEPQTPPPADFRSSLGCAEDPASLWAAPWDAWVPRDRAFTVNMRPGIRMRGDAASRLSLITLQILCESSFKILLPTVFPIGHLKINNK